jgi:hypothetical protein
MGTPYTPPRFTYGTTYGTITDMRRTTVYLPDELKARLAAEAARRQVTEAEIIRQAVDKETRQPRPRGGIFSGDTGGLTGANLHERMEGFGEN